MRTKFQKEKEARHRAVYRDYQKLLQEPNPVAGIIEMKLMRKHGFYSGAAIRKIIQQAEQQLAQEGQPTPANGQSQKSGTIYHNKSNRLIAHLWTQTD